MDFYFHEDLFPLFFFPTIVGCMGNNFPLLRNPMLKCMKNLRNSPVLQKLEKNHAGEKKKTKKTIPIKPCEDLMSIKLD